MADDQKILIVDDDADIRTFLEISLSLHGFEILAASDGAEAIEIAIAEHPSLILMDVMMPNVDGLEALRRLRGDARTSDIPVILVTAKSLGADKVAGLADGADDYITKPFDPEELVARVQSTMRRTSEMRTVSPLTGLPGNSRIELELARRVDSRESFSLMYADLNQFKAYNDYYGFMAGDKVLKGLSELLLSIVAELRIPTSFVGHIGGDDFVLVVPEERTEDVARAICEQFDAIAPSFYKPKDIRLGYIEVTDRQGRVTQFGPVSVSVGIAGTRTRTFTHSAEVVSIATEMKSFAKHASQGISNWALDRRGDKVDASAPGDAAGVERRSDDPVDEG